MADKSAIEWTDATWNPIVGCTIVSPGCTNCYAMKMAARIIAMAGTRNVGVHYDRTIQDVKGKPVWTGVVKQAPERTLLEPLRWKKPRRIFVNSMGDLFHESIPDEWIDKVFAVMALCPQHTFQVLTKRAERMRAYCARRGDGIIGALVEIAPPRKDLNREVGEALDAVNRLAGWPLPNVWLGVSCERQQEADERIPHLLQTPAAIRFVSAEPLLGPIDFGGIIVPSRLSEFPNGEPAIVNLDWIIVGGESGGKARPMHPDWARSIRDQCAAAGVAFFFKQHGQFVPESCAARDHQGAHTSQTFGKSCVKQDGEIFWSVGKKAAGRLLDGKEHNEFPISLAPQDSSITKDGGSSAKVGLVP